MTATQFTNEEERILDERMSGATAGLAEIAEELLEESESEPVPGLSEEDRLRAENIALRAANQDLETELKRSKAKSLQTENNDLRYRVERARQRIEKSARELLETVAMLLADTAVTDWAFIVTRIDPAAADVLLRVAIYLCAYSTGHPVHAEELQQISPDELRARIARLARED